MRFSFAMLPKFLYQLKEVEAARLLDKSEDYHASWRYSICKSNAKVSFFIKNKYCKTADAGRGLWSFWSTMREAEMHNFTPLHYASSVEFVQKGFFF